MAQNIGSQQQDTELEGLFAEEMEGKYLTFFTDGQLYGIPITNVVQIIGIQEITKVPEFPYYAKGIINLRGSIIPIIDMRLRFGKDEIAYSQRTCIIVARIGEKQVGFVVDGVDEVTEIPDDAVSDSPNIFSDNVTNYICGVGKHDGKVVLLIDTSNVISDMAFGDAAIEGYQG